MTRSQTRSGWLLASALILLATPVSAQDAGAEEQEAAAEKGELVEPTPAQLEMNGKAIQAVNEQKWDTAIKLFQASIELGKLNITYVNMGRTYQRMGECVKAKETYRKARDTKLKVMDPPPAAVDKVLNEYEAELYRTCPNGELVVECDPRGLDLFINTRGPQECPGADAPLKLPEGEYVLKGEMDGYESKEVAVTIKRVERVQAAISLNKEVEENDGGAQAVQNGLNPKDPAQVEIVVKTDNSDKDDSNAVAWVNLGVGTALVLGGLFWDSCMFSWNREQDLPVSERDTDRWCAHTYDGEFNALDVAPTALYVIGGLLMLNGVFRF